MQTINITLQIPNQEDLNLLLKLVKRLGIKTLDIQVIQSKHHQGVDKQKLKQITQSIDIPQSTNELLNML